LKFLSGIILGPKAKREETKDHDDHQRKNRVQSSERHFGENDRKKQDKPVSSGRSQRIINRIQERGETIMEKTGAKDKEKFAKKAGKTWLDPMATPFGTR